MINKVKNLYGITKEPAKLFQNDEKDLNMIIKVGYMFFIFINIVILFSCNNKKEKMYSKGFSFLCDSSVGFMLPDFTRVFDKKDELTLAMKQLNPNQVFFSFLDTIHNKGIVFTVSRFKYDSIIPMERWYLYIVKNVFDSGDSMRLCDFGMYEKGGIRYRYTLIQPAMTKGVYKESFYFMKNDLDSVVYQFAISTHYDNLKYADSVLASLVESFQYLK